MKYINRLGSEKFTTLLKGSSRDVLLVEGARQVGKTTFIQNSLSEFGEVYVANFEKDFDLLRAVDRSGGFTEFSHALASHFKQTTIDKPGAILFVDEAQESSKLGAYVRSMKEDWKNVRVILSGSSMTRLFRQDQRIPVGRYRKWLIGPFSFAEFVNASEKNQLIESLEKLSSAEMELSDGDALHLSMLNMLDQYLRVGGLPEAVAAYFGNGDYRRIRNSILDSLEDDFVRKSQLSERLFFQLGLKGVSNFVGFQSKYSHVYESKQIAEKIISELEGWNLVFPVEQRSISSTTVHLPKRYLYDIGIAQDCRDMPFPNLSVVSTQNPALRTQLGGLFENIFLNQIYAWQNYDGDVTGWRRPGTGGAEVDFVWRRDNIVVPIECKATTKLSIRHFSSLKSYLDETNQKLGILVSAAPYKVIRSRDKRLINIPLYLAGGDFLDLVLNLYG